MLKTSVVFDLSCCLIKVYPYCFFTADNRCDYFDNIDYDSDGLSVVLVVFRRAKERVEKVKLSCAKIPKEVLVFLLLTHVILQ